MGANPAPLAAAGVPGGTGLSRGLCVGCYETSRRSIFQEEVEEDKELTHDGCKGDLLGFPSGKKALIEGTQNGISPAGAWSSHIKGRDALEFCRRR